MTGADAIWTCRDRRCRSARLERLGDRATRIYTGLVFVFLFLPIRSSSIYSFNAGRHVTELKGFSTQWYASAWSDQFLIERACATA